MVVHAWVFFNQTKQVTSSVCLVPNTGERAMFFTSHPPTYLPKLDDSGLKKKEQRNIHYRQDCKAMNKLENPVLFLKKLLAFGD